MTRAQRMAALFDGYTKAYGRWTSGPPELSGKVKGKSWTERGMVTAEHFARHLSGAESLGVIMLRDDDTVVFGAIDYDNRGCDHVELEARVRSLALPLVVCRSKSGGAHLYCFLAEPVAAYDVRDALTHWSAALGLSGSEVFPKQTSRFNDNDIGSFLNLPYFNAEHTERPAVIDGVAVGLDAFLAAAEEARAPAERLLREPVAQPGLFADGPPCLQHLARHGGFAEGGRNNGMTAVAVYLKKRYPEDWSDHMAAYNSELARLKNDELQAIITSYGRKQYLYRCKESPLKDHCNSGECVQRLYGIGLAADVAVSGVTRYRAGNQSTYALEIAGQRMWVDASVLASKDKFNTHCMHVIGRCPIHMKAADWQLKVDGLLRDAEVIDDPVDASEDGQLWEWVERFLTQQAHAITWDEVFLGKVYRATDGRTHFRSTDMYKYLGDRRIKFDSTRAVWALLRSRGAVEGQKKISGKNVHLWSLPTPVQPDSDGPAALPEQRETF